MEVAVAVGESLATVKRRLARVTQIVTVRASVDPALSMYVKESSDV
ncbi:MAG: hypothetical protein U0270_43920 [Labilithrix sp.]